MRVRYHGVMLSSMRRLSLPLVVGLLAAACGTTAGTQPAVVLAAPSATTAPTVVPSPTTSPGGPAPVSAGAVPEAGVIYVWGADDGIYRYDGATGALTRTSGASTLAREGASGPYVLGRHGGITLLKWDGSTEVACSTGIYAAVSSRGSCAYTTTDHAVYVDDASGARQLLPADWGASQYVWSPDGAELAIIRTALRPEPVRAHQTLWRLDRHGSLSKIYDSASPTSFLFGMTWSFGRRMSFWESATTSASFGADGVLTSLHVVNVDTAAETNLGTTLQDRDWAQWSADGRLAYVSGGDRTTWHLKQVKVLLPDGRIETIAGDGALHPGPGSTSAIAPVWRAEAGTPDQLAWIEGPAAEMEASSDYFRGIGPTAQRVAVLAPAARVACPGLVTEGVRLSADGTSALLLCRVPAVEHHALQLWLAPIGGTPRLLVTGLGDQGFGFYGMQPSLLGITAWSLAAH
jgi:hypothetical protein